MDSDRPALTRLGSSGRGGPAPPTVSDSFVDELYARAGEREQNPDIDEREDYKAPS